MAFPPGLYPGGMDDRRWIHDEETDPQDECDVVDDQFRLALDLIRACEPLNPVVEVAMLAHLRAAERLDGKPRGRGGNRVEPSRPLDRKAVERLCLVLLELCRELDPPLQVAVEALEENAVTLRAFAEPWYGLRNNSRKRFSTVDAPRSIEWISKMARRIKSAAATAAPAGESESGRAMTPGETGGR